MAEYIFESEDEAISALGATQQPNIYDFDTEEDAIKALSGGEESSMWKRAGDVGVSLLKGAVGLPEAMTGLMDIQTLGYAGKGAEALGVKFKEAKDILDTWYTPEQQEANIKVADAKGFFPTIGAHLQNPSTIIQSIAESAPSMVGAGGIGRTIAKAGSNIMPQLAQSSGLLARTLSSPATMPIIGSAIGEGAISAGQSAEQTRQLSDTGTITPTQALTSSASGALTTLINLAGGKLAQYLGIPDLDTLMAGGGKAVVKDMAEYEAKNRLRKMAESAINEGLLQELPQSMQEQIASNLNQGKKWDEGVQEAGATGMVTGMGMGFGGGAIAPNIVRRQNTPDDMIRTWATGIKDDISNGNMTEEDVGEIKDALNRISDNEVVNRMKEALVGIEMPDGMADGISIANTLAEQEGGDAEYGQKEEMQEAEGQITPTGADIPSTTAPFMDETVSRVVPETNIDGEQGDYIGDVEKIDSGANERVEIIPPEAIIEEPLTQEIVPGVTKNIEQPIPQMLDDLTQPTPIPEDTPVVPEIKPDELIEKGTLVPQQGRTISEKDEEMEKQADLAKPEPTPVDLPTFNSKQEKILFGLHNAEAGRREIIIDKVTGQKKTIGVKSTFPSWIPRELRKKDLIEKALVHIYDSTTPTGKVATLHGLIMDRLDNVATTIDMSEFINEDELIAREEQIEREIADEKARLTAEGITEFGEIEKSVEREISTEKIEITKKAIERLTVDELRAKVKPDKPKQDMIGGTEDIFNLSGQEVEAENIRERIKKKEKADKEQAAKKAEEALNKKAELFGEKGETKQTIKFPHPYLEQVYNRILQKEGGLRNLRHDDYGLELAGDRYSNLRTSIMSAIEGKPISKSKSGINALQHAVYEWMENNLPEKDIKGKTPRHVEPSESDINRLSKPFYVYRTGATDTSNQWEYNIEGVLFGGSAATAGFYGKDVKDYKVNSKLNPLIIAVSEDLPLTSKTVAVSNLDTVTLPEGITLKTEEVGKYAKDNGYDSIITAKWESINEGRIHNANIFILKAGLDKIEGFNKKEPPAKQAILNKKWKLIEKGLDKGKVEDVKSQYESLVKDGTVQEVETGQTPDNNISRPSTVQQRPEVISERTGSYETGTTKVSNFDDVARIAWNLVNSPEEHLISILTDQNDKVVSVHKVSKGTMNFSVAHPVTIVGQALNTPDAKNIWLAHNHPSGVSDLSNEDRTLTQILMDVALGTGVKVHGMIAISPDSYTYFGMDESGTTQESEMPMPEITVKGEVPIMERRFVKHAKGLQQIRNERDALETLRNKFGNSKGILLLNNKNMPVGSIIVQTPWMNIRGLVQRRILQEADITNANQLMAYDPTNITTLDERKNIVNFGKVTGMAVLDVFDKNGSARASGNMSAPFGTFFLKSSDLPKFTPSSSEPTKVSSWVKDFQKLLNVEGIDFKVVSSSNQFPVNAKALIKEGDVAVAVYVDGTIYINSQEIGNRTNLNQVAFHELIHAAGILKILKNNEPKLYNKAIKALDEFKAKNKDTWNTLLRDNSFNINNPVHNEMAYEELLARIAEQKPKGGLIFRIKEIIRKLLRKLGINERYSDKDIIGNLIKQSMAQARMVSEFNEMRGEARFLKKSLSGLYAEARKYATFEEFKEAFDIQIKHGTYWHWTDDPNFTIDKEKGPRDMSTLSTGGVNKGKLMITSHLMRWSDYGGEKGKGRKYVALIDMSDVPAKSYYQVNRGFGNEIFVQDPSKAKVVAVYSREKAYQVDRYKHSQLPQNDEALKMIYDEATQPKFLLAGKKAKGAALTKALKFHNITKSKFQEMISYDPKGFDFSVKGFSRLVENLYSKIFMKEYPLVKFVKDVAGKEMAEEVEQSLRRFRGRSYVVKEMLDGKGVVTYGKYGDEAVQYIKGSKSLKDVLSPLENNAEYMDYESWRIAKMLTALSMHDPNYKMPDGMAQKAQEEIDRVERKYGDDIDRFIKVDKDHRQFEQYAILQPLVDVGWMSEETYKKITTSPTSQYYAALQRVIDDVGGVVGGKEPVKRRYGTTEEMDFIPSAESTISNIVKAVKLVESQKISQELVKLRNMFPAMEEVMEEKKPHYKDVQISHKAEVDPTMRKQLTDFLDKLGVSVETLNSLGRNKLGEFIIDDDRIRLMFASTEKTFAHELGHFLDKRYNLVDHFMTGSTSWSAIKKELRAIADQRADLDSSEYYKKYVRKRPEQIAEFISRYLTQPDQANALAPNAVKKLESFIYTHPELKPLLAIRPSGRKALAMSIGTIKVKSDIPPQGTIVVSKNGIKTFYSLPNDILKSIDFYKSNEMSSIIKVLSIPGRILRAGATTTIDFVFRNMIRDQFSAMVYSKYGYVPYWDFAKGIAHVLKKDDMFHEWQASGAGEAFLFSIDRLGVNTKVRDLLKNPGFRLKTFNPIEALRYISGLSEMGTRLGVYAKARNKGASTLAAMTQAREATTDFNRRGGDSAVRAISQMAAFFNANLQGMDLMRRKMFSKEGFTTKQGAKRWLKVLMGITMPSIILWAINHDDDRYKELPAWQKDLFWIIIPPGKDSTIIRIPKPFELGILFGTLPERMLSWMFDKDPKAMKEVARTIIENGFASPIPTAAVPILENITNYSFFTDRPIESTTLKNLPSGQRATTSTTEFAKLFGNVTNISPVQFENMIRGWSGSLGKKALEMVSMPLEDDIPIVDRKIIEKPWFPLPGLFARDPIGSVSDSVNNFYKIYSDVQQAYTLYRNLQKSGKTDEAKEYFDKNKQDIVMAKQARNIATMLSALRKEILAVQNSTTIDSKTKRERIDKMKTQMTKLAKMYGERYYKEK